MSRPQASRTSAAAAFVSRDGTLLPDTFPACKPRTARLAGAATWAWGPGNGRSDRYYLSGDRRCQHWLLWLQLEGEDGPAVIGAWCRRQGLSQPQAALLLLRTFWEGEEAEESDAGLGAPAYLDGGSLLSTVDLRRLAKAIWHGEVA